MQRLTMVLIFVFSAAATAQDSALSQQNPVFTPGRLANGTNTTWTFRSRTENSIATLLVDSEGTEAGAVPDGYAQVVIRSQDELRDPSNRVLSSSDMNGHLRVMSHSFGSTTDPRQGACRGTQCPDSFEVLSSKHLRLTTNAGGTIDLLTGNEPRVIVTAAGEVIMPDLRAPRGERYYICADEDGRLRSQDAPCGH